MVKEGIPGEAVNFETFKQFILAEWKLSQTISRDISHSRRGVSPAPAPPPQCLTSVDPNPQHELLPGSVADLEITDGLKK